MDEHRLKIENDGFDRCFHVKDEHNGNIHVKHIVEEKRVSEENVFYSGEHTIQHELKQNGAHIINYTNSTPVKKIIFRGPRFFFSFTADTYAVYCNLYVEALVPNKPGDLIIETASRRYTIQNIECVEDWCREANEQILDQINNTTILVTLDTIIIDRSHNTYAHFQEDFKGNVKSESI